MNDQSPQSGPGNAPKPRETTAELLLRARTNCCEGVPFNAKQAPALIMIEELCVRLEESLRIRDILKKAGDAMNREHARCHRALIEIINRKIMYPDHTGAQHYQDAVIIANRSLAHPIDQTQHADV